VQATPEDAAFHINSETYSPGAPLSVSDKSGNFGNTFDVHGSNSDLSNKFDVTLDLDIQDRRHFEPEPGPEPGPDTSCPQSPSLQERTRTCSAEVSLLPCSAGASVTSEQEAPYQVQADFFGGVGMELIPQRRSDERKKSREAKHAGDVLKKAVKEKKNAKEKELRRNQGKCDKEDLMFV
jgi:hypothetical protein